MQLAVKFPFLRSMSLQEMLDYGLFAASYLEVFLAVFFYFSLLYFVLGFLVERTSRFLVSKSILHKIVYQDIAPGQLKRKIAYSLSSILVFALTADLLVFLMRVELLHIAKESWKNLLLGLFVLSLWNEIHFFIVHRLLHTPRCMRQIHYIHHLSRVPTVYSIYSFHWVEAFALGLVPIVVLCMMPLSPMTLALYPIVSILINWVGHVNYRFGHAKGPSWINLASNHNQHH